MWLPRWGLIKGGNAAFVYNPCGPLDKGTISRFAPSRGIADGSAIFIIRLLDFFWEAFFLYISLRFRFMVTSVGAYKGRRQAADFFYIP